MLEYITKSIEDSIEAKRQILSNSLTLATIAKIGESLYTLFGAGGKVLICGNGGSAADAQHIAAEFVGRFIYDRRGLHAVALTTDSSIVTAVSNDYGFETIFSRQVEALGSAGDIFIAISTSGNSANVVKALVKARQMGLTTVGLLGGSGGECLSLCDYSIVVGSSEAARVQESHILIGHILCGMVDEMIHSDEK